MELTIGLRIRPTIDAVKIFTRNPLAIHLKQNIIVLEDDSDIGNLVRHHLQAAGFNVRLCASGDTIHSGNKVGLRGTEQQSKG
jgi:PleD family two-component response regulator